MLAAHSPFAVLTKLLSTLPRLDNCGYHGSRPQFTALLLPATVLPLPPTSSRACMHGAASRTCQLTQLTKHHQHSPRMYTHRQLEKRQFL
jgi:hypothetical protein